MWIQKHMKTNTQQEWQQTCMVLIVIPLLFESCSVWHIEGLFQSSTEHQNCVFLVLFRVHACVCGDVWKLWLNLISTAVFVVLFILFIIMHVFLSEREWKQDSKRKKPNSFTPTSVQISLIHFDCLSQCYIFIRLRLQFWKCLIHTAGKKK